MTPARHDDRKTDKRSDARRTRTPSKSTPKAAARFDEIGPPPTPSDEPVLTRLGPLPLACGNFRIMGFMASVYEQVSRHAETLSRGLG